MPVTTRRPSHTGDLTTSVRVVVLVAEVTSGLAYDHIERSHQVGNPHTYTRPDAPTVHGVVWDHLFRTYAKLPGIFDPSPLLYARRTRATRPPPVLLAMSGMHIN